MGNEHMHPGGDNTRWDPVLIAHWREIHHWTEKRIERYKTLTPLAVQHVREHRRPPMPDHALDDLASPSFPDGGPRD